MAKLLIRMNLYIFIMNIEDESGNSIELQNYSGDEDEIESESEIDSSDNDSVSSMDDHAKDTKIIELEDLEESYYYQVLWSAEEKEKLFQGIEKYGKWNVNKIKKLLPNKTLIDIRMYISLLHKKYKYIKNNRSHDLYSRNEIYRYYEHGISESTEEEIKEEEEKAKQLVLEEQTKFNGRHEFDLNHYQMILNLFNIQFMLALTTKVFIRKREAGIHKDTLVYIYLQYIHWLREVIKTVIVVTEKRRLKRKKKSKIYISLEDLNESFYLLNFKNYSADSPLSKLLFRKQGHLVLKSIFKIKSSFFNNDFIHPDAKKSILDEELNTWVRPYDIQSRFYHSHYNSILHDPEQFKKYVEQQKLKKTEYYQNYMEKQKNKNNKKEEKEEERREGMEDGENGQEEEGEENIKGFLNLEEDEEIIPDNEDDEEEEINIEDEEDEDINIDDNEEEEEEEEDDDDDENDNNDEENEEYENMKKNNYEEYDEPEDSIYEDIYSTDENYTDTNIEDEESHIDKLISSSFITRRSSQRISNSQKRNRESESYESNKRRR
ncbi:hypothetical protein BCR36DRAFT_411796 [Piromyces finnis]|uniref:Myb-like domain-containing protein n=1 Tax=Piromyces finnis TaxID=1754191 RepID=A0A1Y1VBB3_9FUNG|nr:hypothetical protein BCR36DRAFT_411796 [Piromyces finnis]|eukprot:ORX51841.1 hypothetical protein BCR36DRAFT_411796 [Piromyces finnis]